MNRQEKKDKPEEQKRNEREATAQLERTIDKLSAKWKAKNKQRKIWNVE